MFQAGFGPDQAGPKGSLSPVQKLNRLCYKSRSPSKLLKARSKVDSNSDRVEAHRDSPSRIRAGPKSIGPALPISSAKPKLPPLLFFFFFFFLFHAEHLRIRILSIYWNVTRYAFLRSMCMNGVLALFLGFCFLSFD